MKYTRKYLIETAQWLIENAVIVDTETTGLGENDTVVELAAVRASDGVVLVNALTAPRSIMQKEAFDIHGISEHEALSAPAFFFAYEELQSKMSDGEYLTSFNRGFDERLVRQSQFKNGFSTGAWPAPHPDHEIILCIMELANRYFHEHLQWDDEQSKFRRLSLNKCLEITGIEFTGNPHRALTDTRAAHELLKYISDGRMPA